MTRDDSDDDSFLLLLTTHTWLNLTVKDAAEKIKSNEKRVFFFDRDIHAHRHLLREVSFSEKETGRLIAR
jgi:hypothetical protein